MLGQVHKQQMRKRSKYRPRPVLRNPVGFVLEGFTPARAFTQFMLDLKLKNHSAMASLTRGVATRDEVDIVIQMVNMTEALFRIGIGCEYGDVVDAALGALHDAAARGAAAGRFVLRGEEMRSLNTAMELHDEQMEVATLHDMERAIDIVRKEFERGRMKRIPTTQ